MLILFVMYLFKTSSSRIQASFWAGVLFVLLPISMMLREWTFFRLKNRIWWVAILQFWIFFAIPIFALRLIYPYTSLNEVSVGPIRVALWHQISSYSYTVLMAVTAWSWWITRKTTSPRP